MRELKTVPVYTIVSTGIDTDRGYFPDPESKGSYLSLTRARLELSKLINEEKKELDSRYDCEERSEDHWEACEKGYAAANFTRIEILASQLCLTPLGENDFALTRTEESVTEYKGEPV